AIEEQFYLLFAPLVLLVPRAYTMGVCLACITAGMAARLKFAIDGALPISIYVNSLVNFAMLGFGGALGLLAVRPMPKLLTTGTAQAVLLGCYLALPVFIAVYSDVWRVLGTWLVAPVAGSLLVQIFQGQRSWLVAALEAPAARTVGRISYG